MAEVCDGRLRENDPTGSRPLIGRRNRVMIPGHVETGIFRERWRPHDHKRNLKHGFNKEGERSTNKNARSGNFLMGHLIELLSQCTVMMKKQEITEGKATVGRKKQNSVALS